MSLGSYALTVTCALALTAPAPEVLPQLAPAAGTRVKRCLEQSSQISLDSWEVVWNGNPVPAQFLPKLEIESSETILVEVEDEYLECAEGRINRLRRKIVEADLEGHIEVLVDGATPPDEPSGAHRGESRLAGCVVLIEAAGKQRTLEEGDCPREAIDQLPVDLDLTALADPREVDRADGGWECELELQSPIDLMHAFAIEIEGPESQRADPLQLRENASGTWQVRPVGTRDEEGAQLLALEIKSRITTHAQRATNLDEVPIVDGAATELTELTGVYQGQLLWDNDAGRLHSADLTAELNQTVTTTRDLEGIEGESTYKQVMHFSGKTALSITTEPLE